MDKFQLFPDQASTNAHRVDELFFFLCAVTVFFTILIFILVLTFALKYRRRSDADRPPVVHPNILLEVTWIGIPVVLVLIMFGWGAAVFVNASRPPADAMEINVVGKQWMWKIQHPQGQREINELHVPTGRAVKLVITSQDVIHDFAVPAFRIKMDVIPGRYVTEWFNANRPGSYHIFCNQYCGTLHSQMIGTVVVMEPDKYQDWLSGRIANETPAEAGQKLFTQFSCINCHSQRAPSLAGVYGSKVRVWQNGALNEVVADDQYIRDSIVNPNLQIVEGYPPLMPSFGGMLTEEQISQLIAYIRSLGVQGGPTDIYKMNNRIPPPPPAQPEIYGGGMRGGVTK